MSHASRILTDAWARDGALARFLAPFSLIFAALTSARRALYRHGLLHAQHLPVPVIVVGNLTVGGTGKTPLVIHLALLLRAHGFHPGVVSRGYGGSYSRSHQNATAVTSDDATLFGDEIVLIRRRTGIPAAIGRRRAQAARTLLALDSHIDVVICDDGLQHYALSREIEIAVFDSRGAGNGRLLPAGPLREPLKRLATVDAVVFNGLVQAVPGLAARRVFAMQLTGSNAYQLRDPQRVRPLADIASPGETLLAAAGIGHPERFFAFLRAHGVDCDTLALPDHYSFEENPFGEVTATLILVTEKDAVKCAGMEDPRIWVVPVETAIDEAFDRYILEKLDAHKRT